MAAEPRLSVILPVLNEAEGLAPVLEGLRVACPPESELIVVDGGSNDGTPDIARRLADRVLASAPGRARQMNAGAAVARGELLWFLHGDTRVPAGAGGALLAAVGAGRGWGRFDVRLSGGHPAFRVIERMMNLRSRLTGICTGDQGIFVRRADFAAVGGYPELPLMEDIELSRLLRRRLGPPACLRPPLVTSSRRWERRGILRTVLLMWWLRLAWWAGVPAGRLAAWYR